MLGDEAYLSELAGLLQVTIRDGALRVVEGHKVGLDVGRKRLAPCVRVAVVVVEHSSHAGLGSVGGAQERRFLGHYFCQVGGSLAETGSERGEGVYVAAKVAVDGDSVGAGSSEGQLQGAEEASAARDGGGHEAQLAKVPLPVFVADSVRGGEFREDVG